MSHVQDFSYWINLLNQNKSTGKVFSNMSGDHYFFDGYDILVRRYGFLDDNKIQVLIFGKSDDNHPKTFTPHREDGPALYHQSNEVSYWLDNKRIYEKDFNQEVVLFRKKSLILKISNL